jgi:hypothetical protein
MVMSSALVGAVPVMFLSLHLVVETMIASGVSYWELFLVQQLLGAILGATNLAGGNAFG